MGIRTYIEIFAVLIIVAAFSWYTVHERDIGAHKIEVSDAKATLAAQDLADAETKHAQDLANQAEQAAIHEQKTVDNYAITHPVGVVRLCPKDSGSASVPKASAPAGGTTGTSTGPGAVPTVSRGPDIGPELSELMLDAARLALIDGEWQRR